MFDNIGGKIKTLAKVICILGIILSVIAAIALWAANSRYEPTIALGFGTLIGGCLGSWLGSFGMYGFGELIENTAEIRSTLNAMNHRADKTERAVNTAAPVVVPPRPTSITNGDWTCKKCGEKNVRTALYCKACGEYK